MTPSAYLAALTFHSCGIPVVLLQDATQAVPLPDVRFCSTGGSRRLGAHHAAGGAGHGGGVGGLSGAGRGDATLPA